MVVHTCDLSTWGAKSEGLLFTGVSCKMELIIEPFSFKLL
jgi:hypothetical protein